MPISPGARQPPAVRRVLRQGHDPPRGSPLVEQISIDEAFLDVSDDPRPSGDIARSCRSGSASSSGCPPPGSCRECWWPRRPLEVGKPNGLVGAVRPGGELPGPAAGGDAVGVGSQSPGPGCRPGDPTIGDSGCAPAQLERLYGERGTELAARARGQDDSPVVEGHEPRSMSSERTFADDADDWDTLRRHLREMSDSARLPPAAERRGRVYREARAALAGFHHDHPPVSAAPAFRRGW
jgi:DNA polymerase-4